jgi:trans-aconitate 3-methyltransferase
MTSEQNGSKNIFNVTSYNETYWESYLEARPKYTNGNFYEKIFAYHQAHSGYYNVAHDIGTGPGQVAAVLSDRFTHVIASDLNQTHLDVCQHRNAKKRNISCALCSGEEISSHASAGSADTVFCAEALALMNAEEALNAFAEILKPNGTLAVWYYGRPIFTDPECQRIYDEMVSILFGHIIKGGGSPTKTEQWKRTNDIM